MNIIKNDEVILIKEFESLKKVGKTYQVANITDTMVVIRDRSTKAALAAVEIDKFERYFIKDCPKAWTDWIGISDGMGNLTAYYRTNQKRVEVKTVNGKFKGKSSCCKTDDFSLEDGIKLATARCNWKSLHYYADKTEKEMLASKGHLTELLETIKIIDKYITNFKR